MTVTNCELSQYLSSSALKLFDISYVHVSPLSIVSQNTQFSAWNSELSSVFM